ncbi:MAG: DUF4139 domain-containing protein [Verrucomicrobiota bacterium]
MTKSLAILLFASSAAFAAPGLTIYNQDFAVVRDAISLDLKEGENAANYDGATLQLEPDSVVLRDKAGQPLRILEQNYRNDPLTQSYLLSLFEGRTLDFVVREEQKPDRTIQAKILRSGYNGPNGATEPVVEADGKILFGLPGQPQFPSLGDDTVLKPRLEWKIQSPAAAKVEAEIGYITSGLSWQASYNLVSPEKGDAIDLVGWITMDNRSGRDFEKAGIKLMAGDVSKIQPPRPAMRERMVAMAAMDDEAAVTEKAFDEFHLYTLARPTTLRDRETKQVEFLRAAGVKSETVYLFQAGAGDSRRWSGADARFRLTSEEFGGGGDTKISVFREFRNSKENQLGMPLPKGRVRFYRVDGGQLEFTGENEIDHTPADELVRIFTGNAFDLVGERKRTNFRVDTANKRTEESFEILLRNRKKEPVTIRVLEGLIRSANWEITAKSDPFEKKTSDEIEFRIPVKPGEERKLTYTVLYSW